MFQKENDFSDLSEMIVDCSRWIAKSIGFGGGHLHPLRAVRCLTIRREQCPLNLRGLRNFTWVE